MLENIKAKFLRLQKNAVYDIKIKYTDYAGNTSEETVPKFLTDFELDGTPNFTGTNASHAENIFFVGDKISDYGIVAKKYYSDGSSVDVSSSTLIPTRYAYNSSWTPSFSYTEANISKAASIASASGSYYVAKKDALTQKPVKLTNYQGKFPGGTFYKFGDFPQTISNISTVSSSKVYNGWYLGNDGYFYEKYTVDSAGTYSSSFKFSDGSNVHNGDVRYFKVEPVKWRLLGDCNGNRLLFAENVMRGGVPYYLNTNNRTISGKTVYANSYKYSTVRAYLNGNYESDDTQTKTYQDEGFLQKAFTTSARDLIATTKVDNSARSANPDGNGQNWNKGNNTYACDDTYDKIFLLSERDITKSGYGFNGDYTEKGGATNNLRIRLLTDYAKASHAWIQDGGYIETLWGGFYYTRSPWHHEASKVHDVDYHGYGDNQRSCNADNCGIVPALCVSPSELP